VREPTDLSLPEEDVAETWSSRGFFVVACDGSLQGGYSMYP
jgi:hypothetical protein